MIEYKILNARNIRFKAHPKDRKHTNHLFLEVEFYQDGELVFTNSFEIGRPKFVVRPDDTIEDEDLTPDDFKVVPFPIAAEIERIITNWITRYEGLPELEPGGIMDGIDSGRRLQGDDTFDPKNFGVSIQHLIGKKRKRDA